MKTWNAKQGELEQNWYLVDAADQTLGRLATQVARVLRGKHKPTFTPHVDTGDFVVVINADKVKLSGNKWIEKNYYSRSRFFGSLKSINAQQLNAKDPAEMVKTAVSGMLPKTKLGRQMISKLKAYKGGEHPHSAQKPEAMKLI